MSEQQQEPDPTQEHDQDADPSLNAPGDAGPTGIVAPETDESGEADRSDPDGDDAHGQ